MSCPHCTQCPDITPETCVVCSGLHPLVSIYQKVKTFTKAAVKHVAHGMPRPTKEEIARRRAICQSCDKRVNGVCTVCGCNTNHKTSWKLETCPIGKWNHIEGITLAITHWKRPAALARLLDSLAKHLPGVPVEMEDTQGNLSAGRNRLYSRVKTPYLVMLEEDFVCLPMTPQGIRDALAILAADPKVYGVGGIATERGRGAVRWGHNFLPPQGGLCAIEPSQRPLRKVGAIQYRPCDLILNWGVFRTELFQKVQWDENLPIMEHKSWFFTASRHFEFALYGGLIVNHLRDRPSPEYNQARARRFVHRIREKHGFIFAHVNV